MLAVFCFGEKWWKLYSKWRSNDAQYPRVFDDLTPEGGGDYAYEKGEDARRKFWTKPLKQTDPVVAQAFFWPLKEIILKHRQYKYFYIFSRATLNETFTA